MDAEKPAPFSETVYTGDALVAKLLRPPRPAEDILFDLWAWVSGLDSFLGVFDRSIGDNQRPAAATRSRKPEFQITRAAFFKMSELAAELRRVDLATAVRFVDLSDEDLSEFSGFVQDHSILNNALVASTELGYAEWRSWRRLLADRVGTLSLFEKLDAASKPIGKEFLPDNLLKIGDSASLSFSERQTLLDVSIRLSLILRSLHLVSRMLRKDEPLKPSLLIFSGIYEQIRGFADHINNTLARNPNEDTEFFAVLDGASYMAALELKKAYQQELSGIVGLRPAPAIYARVESAYALLNDSFQQILTSFARILEPEISTSDLFPEFQHKLAESLLLRSHLAQTLKAVQAAEQKPDKGNIQKLKGLLATFMEEPVKFLFYKDRESVERFCEEVNAASEKDLVPILHRFAAYLETLFRQVSMRTVLGNHPFEAEKS